MQLGWGAWEQAVRAPGVEIQAAVLVASIALAALVTRVLAARFADKSSVLFGERRWDGALLPILLLAFTQIGRVAVRSYTDGRLLQMVLPVILSLVVIRVSVRAAHAIFPDSAALRTMERSVSWFVWGVAVLWVTGIGPALMEEAEAVRLSVGGTRVTLRNVIEGCVNALLVLVVALWLSAALERRLMKTADRNDRSVRMMAANVVRAAMLVTGVMLALSAAGIPLGALGVFGGALGVGIGMGLQRLAANYVSGFVILAERSIRIGDIIRVDGFEGRITSINSRYSIIRALNGRESIVPNDMLVTSRVENASLADPNVSLNTTVQVAYGSDIAAIEAALLSDIAKIPRVLANPGPSMQLESFGADGLNLRAYFWIADPENGQGNVVDAVNRAILQRLSQMQVDIPFPQRVVTVRADAPLPVQGLGEAIAGAGSAKSPMDPSASAPQAGAARDGAAAQHAGTREGGAGSAA